MNLTVYDREAIESALFDLFANRITRTELEESLADGDYNDAVALVVPAIYRISTKPERPAPTVPYSEGGTPAGVPIETLVAAARQTV